MDEKLKQVAYAAGTDPDVIEKLDQVLNGENDRAFIICSYHDCTNNSQGRCTIFAVQDVPKMKRTAPCERYMTATFPSPS